MADAEKPDPTPPGERIAKVLSRAGVASRREAERMIELGQVAVNGRVIDSPALNVLPSDRITVDGQPVAAPEPARLWLYYKPDGLVTSASDEKGRATVFDQLPEDLPRVMPIGRLDLNSEGLLLLTNDGELKRRLELPSTGWMRKYRVRIKGNPSDPDLEPLRKGLTVEGERFQPMLVVLDRIQGANAWLTVGLREGRNREIRRAMFALNLEVNRLIRISYGPFRLGDLKPGEVAEVRGKVLRDQLGFDPSSEDAPPPSAARPASRTLRPKPASAKPASAKPASAKPADAKPDVPPRPAKPGANWAKARPTAKTAARSAAKPAAQSAGGAAPRTPGSRNAPARAQGPKPGGPGKPSGPGTPGGPGKPPRRPPARGKGE